MTPPPRNADVDALQRAVEDATNDALAVIRARLSAALVDAWWPQAKAMAGLDETRTTETIAEIPHQARRMPAARKAPGHQLVYVYGFVPSTLGSLDGAIAIEAGAKIERIAVDGVTALVSRVPAAAYDEAGLRARLADPEWVAARACAHDAVLRVASERGPVLPLRLCAVYEDDERVRAILSRNRQSIDEALRRLEGHREWGVRVHVEAEALEPSGAAAAEIAALRAEVASARPGRAHFARRRLEQRERELRMELAVELGARVHAALCEASADAVRLEPQTAAVTGRSEPQVLHAAYLVPETRRGGFDAAVARLGRGAGTDLQLTGPWPPFHFSRIELEIPEGADA